MPARSASGQKRVGITDEQDGRKREADMIRSWILLSAIFATLGVALAGCAATPFSPGYYAGGYPYRISGYYCGAWRVWPGASCLDPRAAY
jgi:hypothetical protein